MRCDTRLTGTRHGSHLGHLTPPVFLICKGNAIPKPKGRQPPDTACRASVPSTGSPSDYPLFVEEPEREAATNLAPDFPSRKRRCMNIRVGRVALQRINHRLEISSRDALCRRTHHV